MTADEFVVKLPRHGGHRPPLQQMGDEKILGIEGGGTKTAWALVRGDVVLDSGKLPPSNLRLTTPDQLATMLRSLPFDADAVGVFLAGCATEQDRATLLKQANEIWPKARVVAGSDRDSGLAACLRDADGIVVNAGTGSSVTGRRGDRIENAGGWGHILGDTGGAYFVSIRALRVILRDYDLRRGDRKVAAEVLAALGLNNFDELVRWAQTADKTQIALLAPLVFAAAQDGDHALQRIIRASASALADFTQAVALRLEMRSPQVRLMGGLFEWQPHYVDLFRAAMNEKLPAARIEVTSTPPELGAVWRARSIGIAPVATAGELKRARLPATEEVNSKSSKLDTLTLRQVVELFINEEKSVEAALRSRADKLAQAIELAATAIAKGGRIFYVGAGTSGRLGALDAAEIPPTFGASPQSIQAIVAGGEAALQRSVEGAEDDAVSGALAIETHNVAPADLVIGISASGGAAFVLGALRQARDTGARTILLTCNPHRRSDEQWDEIIDLPTGPEIVAGSTRLKAGTATKIALNMISTGAMVRLGRVRGNLMIDLHPSNRKLRERAVRLVSQLTGCDRETARDRLERAGWNVRAALKE
jgi:N-acetylmuramic acid 6-phosphate etherase